MNRRGQIVRYSSCRKKAPPEVGSEHSREVNTSIGDILIDMVSFSSDIDWSKMFEFLYALGSAFAHVIFLAYIIISERDEYLAKAIDEACRSVSEKDHDNDDDMREKKVVAILGLIHVNGVAKKLVKVV